MIDVEPDSQIVSEVVTDACSVSPHPVDAIVDCAHTRARFVREALTTRTGADSSMASLEDRDAATVAVNLIALERGAMLFRVHNVRANRPALDAAWSILTS